MTSVDVVIPTWNGRALLDRCLAALARQTVQATVIVVDNGSTDGTAEHLVDAWPEVRLVRLDRNWGFGAAVNRGIAAGAAPFIVLVNNDVECDQDFVERLIGPLEEDPAAGSVAGLLLVPGRATIDSYGIEVDRTLAGFGRFRGAPYGSTTLHGRHLAGACGAAAGYRRSALEDVGGFDEAMFAYHEDVDLALRLVAGGWACLGAPDAVGVHLGSASFGPQSDWQVEVSGASRAYLLRKYGVLRSGAGIAARTLAGEVAATLADAVLARRLAAVRGRRRGWRRGRGAHANFAAAVINEEIGVRGSLARRRAVIAR
jgi:GT2 family glycosyltransferase